MKLLNIKACFCIFVTILTVVLISPSPIFASDWMDVPTDKLPANIPNHIDKNNYKQVVHLLTPTIIHRIVEWGLEFDIVPTLKDYKPHPKYLEYSKNNIGKVKIGPDSGLVNYVAGVPFPDPQTALEVMWNFNERYYADDRDYKNPHSNIINSDGYVRHGLTVFYNLKYDGRVNLDPKPVIPNDDNIQYKDVFMSVEPPAVRGVGMLTVRYRDPNRDDDAWLYVPALRRLRRASTAQRGEHFGGTDTTWDDTYAFNGKVQSYTYKLVEKRQILAVLHNAPQDDESSNPEHAVPFYQGGNYEIVPVYVIDAINKEPNYVYSKRRFYITPICDMWEILYEETWDQQGKLWKSIAQRMFIKHTGKGYTYHYTHGMEFVDYQAKHGTLWDQKGEPPLLFDVGMPESRFSLHHLRTMGN